MGKKIICDSCETVFQEHIVKDMKICPVCGGIWEEDEFTLSQKEKTTYYYYKEGGGMLTDILSSSFTPIYTFEAVDLEDAKRQLKEVLPNSSLLNDTPTPQTRCPRCFSTEIQLVPRKFSLITGFATNRFDRMCVRCQKRF